MNGAKIRYSPEPPAGGGVSGEAFYHNIKSAGWGLSPEELTLATDTAVILAKNRVIARTVELFASLGERMRERAPASQAGENGPKISKGENYKGFPWVVLDYPRNFGKEDVFAVRTLFWWGHYFSVTLHLKGRYKTQFLGAIRERTGLLAEAGFHICVSDDEWRHELATDNYRKLSGMGAEELETLLSREGFVKFAVVTALDNEAGLTQTLLRLYDTVISVII